MTLKQEFTPAMEHEESLIGEVLDISPDKAPEFDIKYTDKIPGISTQFRYIVTQDSLNKSPQRDLTTDVIRQDGTLFQKNFTAPAEFFSLPAQE